MTRFITLAFVGLIAASGCADPELEGKVATLSDRVDELEKKVGEMEAGGGARTGGGDEKAAQELYAAVRESIQNLDYDTAKKQIAELESKHGDTRAAKAIRKTKEELEVVGKPQAELQVEKWYTNQTSMDEGKATLVVFWEVWCPHCRREVPKIQETYDNYNDKGLNVIALTKITRSATEEKVQEFLTENNVTYPVAKEKGEEMSNHYGVRGIPAAAVVKDGKVIWRGHPGQLNDEMIEKFIN